MNTFRQQLKTSSRTASGVGLQVASLPVYFTKIDRGEVFAIQVGDAVAARLMSDAGLNRLLSRPDARSSAGGLIVGEYKWPEPSSGFWGVILGANSPADPGPFAVPVDEDHLLPTFVEAAGQALDKYLNSVGQWPSYAEYLEVAAGLDYEARRTTTQAPQRYRWLVGPVSAAGGVHPVRAYEDLGVYVSDDGLVPVFSSHLEGGLACDRLRDEKGIELVPESVHCLGCYLTALSEDLGRELLRGALLNGQWHVVFECCDEHGAPGAQSRLPTHHFLQDGAARYLLTGCTKDGTHPFFVPESLAREHLACARERW